MKEQEKQLLLKDLCARLPYGVKASGMGWDEEKREDVYVPVTVYSVNTDGYVHFADNDYDIDYCSIDACRLYLRPMSSMTDEECKELGKLITIYDMVDWMLAHHFDVHNLIEKGLALEAPEGLYKK